MKEKIYLIKTNTMGSFFKSFLGIRMIKTALAISLSLAIAQALDLSTPLMAGLSAIVTMTSSIFDSVNKGLYRVLSTAIGGILAALFRDMGLDGFIGLFIGVILIINFCNLMKWKDATSLALFVFVIVMLHKPAPPDYLSVWQYGINRILDTGVGIMVGVLVNMLVFPPNQSLFILKSYQKSLKDCEDALVQSLMGHKVNMDRIIQDLHSINDELKTIKQDGLFSTRKRIRISDMSKINGKFYMLFASITQFTDAEIIPTIDESNKLKINNYFGMDLSFEDTPSCPEDLETAFNYYLDEAINTMVALKTEIQALEEKI